jgi:hypothetical protein
MALPAIKPTTATFAQRLASEAERLKNLLSETLSAAEREVLKRRLDQIESAAEVDRWISSASLANRSARSLS